MAPSNREHEKEPRWTATDEFAEQCLHATDSPYYEALNYALQLSRDEDLPDIAVSSMQGKFLALQCKLLRAQSALEVGTLGGYSTIWMASANPDIKITTVEYAEKHKAVADKAFAHAKLDDRIKCLLGSGIDVLPRLRKEVEQGQREKFDFVFIDADKENNLNYLNEAILMCRSGGCIIVDNVVRQGRVGYPEEAEKDSRVAGSRKVIEGAGKDSRVTATVLQTVGAKSYDGFLLCVVH